MKSSWTWKTGLKQQWGNRARPIHTSTNRSASPPLSTSSNYYSSPSSPEGQQSRECNIENWEDPKQRQYSTWTRVVSKGRAGYQENDHVPEHTHGFCVHEKRKPPHPGSSLYHSFCGKPLHESQLPWEKNLLQGQCQQIRAKWYRNHGRDVGMENHWHYYGYNHCDEFLRGCLKQRENVCPRSRGCKRKCETPVLLLVSAGLLKWMLVTHQTPWELHNKIKIIQPELVGDVLSEYLKSVLQWCLRTTQIASGASGALHLQPVGVLMISEPTLEWMRDHLKTTIGSTFVEMHPLLAGRSPYQTAPASSSSCPAALPIVTGNKRESTHKWLRRPYRGGVIS